MTWNLCSAGWNPPKPFSLHTQCILDTKQTRGEQTYKFKTEHCLRHIMEGQEQKNCLASNRFHKDMLLPKESFSSIHRGKQAGQESSSKWQGQWLLKYSRQIIWQSLFHTITNHNWDEGDMRHIVQVSYIADNTCTTEKTPRQKCPEMAKLEHQHIWAWTRELGCYLQHHSTWRNVSYKTLCQVP